VNSLSRKPLTIAMEEIANGLVEAEHQQETAPTL
jgi:DNA-directed RNA polymerase subunit K/omega